MALVRERMYGETKVEFYDDYYINRTPEEVQAIIERVSEIIYSSIPRVPVKDEEEIV